MDVTVDITDVNIQTGRLLLRPWAESDMFDFYSYASVPGVGEMAGWECHKSYNTTRRVMQEFMDGKNVFAITHRRDGKVIGSFGLHKSWANEDDLYSGLRLKEFGFVLSKDYWGQGLMPEAVGAVTAYCFDALGLDAVTCGHFKDNARSRRVIEKSGFRFVRECEFYAKQLNRGFEDYKYILLKSERDECGRGNDSHG